MAKLNIRIYCVVATDFAGLKGFTAAKCSIFVVDRKGFIRHAWISEDPRKEPNYKEIEILLKKIE